MARSLSSLRKRLARDESGFTLPELLVASSIMIVIMGSIYGVMATFERGAQRTRSQNNAQEQARAATDRLAWQLRNLVTPANPTGGPFEVSSSYDLVFQTITPTGGAGSNSTRTGRVRYCYDNSTPATAKLWLQTQTWTTATAPAIPSTAICPSSSWATQQVVASSMVNQYNGANRPVFTTVAYPASSTDPADIVSLRTDLYVDEDATRAPAETRLSTALALRNANRRPIASFTTAQVGTSIRLDASPSIDPEGQALTYAWSVSGGTCSPAPAATTITDCAGLTSGSTATFTLTVTDPGGLTSTTSNSVTVQ